MEGKQVRSEITGRKDYPIFINATDDKIVEHLKNIEGFEIIKITEDYKGRTEIETGTDQFIIDVVNVVDFNKESIVLNNIDFDKLREQKNILINMIRDWSSTDDLCQRKEAQEIEGIVNLIDNIQDYAVDIIGMSEKRIFNLNN